MGQELSVEAFRHTLSEHGLTAALAFLNEGVAHRYTAAYRVDGDVVRQVAVFDKAGRAFPEAYVDVPFELSFAQYVVRDGVFRTQDSSKDCRLAGHPYRGILASYQGVAIYGGAGGLGSIIGSLCHFDVNSLAISAEEFGLLQACAACLGPETLWPKASAPGSDLPPRDEGCAASEALAEEAKR